MVELDLAGMGFLPNIEAHLIAEIEKASIVGIVAGANEVTAEIADDLQILRHRL